MRHGHEYVISYWWWHLWPSVSECILQHCIGISLVTHVTVSLDIYRRYCLLSVCDNDNFIFSHIFEIQLQCHITHLGDNCRLSSCSKFGIFFINCLFFSRQLIYQPSTFGWVINPLIDNPPPPQWSAARYVCNNYSYTSSVTCMLKSLNWHTLEYRRNKSSLMYFYKIWNALVHVDHHHLIPTRNLNYLIPHSNTRYHSNSYFPRTIRLWNSLPGTVQA